MFKVTPQAAEQVKVAAEQGGTVGMALRLAAQQRPDGSIDYRMGFDEGTEDDIRFSSEGVQIVMAPGSARASTPRSRFRASSTGRC